MNSYRFLFNSPCTRTYIWLVRNGARDVDSTTLQISCRSQVRSVGRDVVRVDEPTPILQVKSADAAECKVHRCITRNRARDVPFATRGEIEGEGNIQLYVKCSETLAYIAFLLCTNAVDNYSTVTPR